MLDCISDKFVKPEVKQQVLLLFVEMGEKMSSNLAFMVALNEKRQIVMSGYQVRSFFLKQPLFKESTSTCFIIIDFGRFLNYEEHMM